MPDVHVCGRDVARNDEEVRPLRGSAERDEDKPLVAPGCAGRLAPAVEEERLVAGRGLALDGDERLVSVVLSHDVRAGVLPMVRLASQPC